MIRGIENLLAAVVPTTKEVVVNKRGGDDFPLFQIYMESRQVVDYAFPLC